MSFLAIDDQLELFAGVAFDPVQNKAILPGGKALNRGQFNVTFGGFVFAMDKTNERTTRSAWTAFTQNQGYRPPLV